MAEETAEFTSAEALVSGLVMRIVGNHAVVAGLSGCVGDDCGADVGATAAFDHANRHFCLHLAHAFLSATHVGGVALVLFFLGGLTTNKLKESLPLLGGGRLI